MAGAWRRWVLLAAVGLVGCRSTASAVREEPERAAQPRAELHFDPVTVTADLELDRLNDEELFAGGTSAFAAEDFKQAARYFNRLVDFHPQSRHRREALYKAGVALERLEQWEEASLRFSELADAARGQEEALEAAFRLAVAYYQLERFSDAAGLLATIARRTDIPLSRRLEAQVQQGICELESGQPERAESTLRGVVSTYEALEDKDEVNDFFPAQAHFFIGELYRLRYEAVELDPSKGSDVLARDLNYKAELLLSAQGHYLRAVRVGNSYWTTASGAQIGALYENLYHYMINSPAPAELDAEAAEVYREELRKQVRNLLTKSINIYERTLEAAERIGSHNAFVDRTRESLKKMKELLLAEPEPEPEPPPQPPVRARRRTSS